MTVQKFTPGPWMLSEPTVIGEFEVTAPDKINPTDDPWNIAIVAAACGYPDDQTHHNALLIAAAPDLFVALQLAADTLRGFDEGDPTTETGWKHDELCDAWVKINAALAKAGA